jgi:hypothetical protein
MLKLYNYALGQEAITSNWGSLGSQVFGMKNLQKNSKQFKVFPNPVNDLLNVDLSSYSAGKEVKLTLINSEGLIVKEINTNAGESPVAIETGSLPAGLYMLRSTQGCFTDSKKVVIR